MKAILFLIGFLLVFGFSFFNGNHYENAHKTRSDTLNVGYTYWWPSGGPFTGLCGNTYSMVFTGTITELYEPENSCPNGRNVGEVIWTPQKGVIKINKVEFNKSPEKGYKTTAGRNYDGENYFTSECFFGSGLSEGDKVMVFIYSYEGEYCIPGNSILKIESFSDAAVLSIQRYIKSGQDPLVMEGDTSVWRKYNLDYALKEIIRCRKETNDK